MRMRNRPAAGNPPFRSGDFRSAGVVLTLGALTLAAASAGIAAEPAPAPTPPHAAQKFFADYCVKCHGPEKQKAERRFDTLPAAITKQDHLTDFQDIIDQLNLGEMPPPEEKQPPRAEVSALVAQLAQQVSAAHAQFASTGGRTVLRRLNRREYLNTVGVLFGLNMTMFDPTTKFPRDQMAAHMDNLGDVLKTSGYLIAQYFDAADEVVEKAFEQAERPAEQTWRFISDFKQQQELNSSHASVFNHKFIALYETMLSVRNEGSYGPLMAFAQGVPADGFYEIRVKAEARNRLHPYAPDFFVTDPTIPFRMGLVPGTLKAGPLHRLQPIEPVLGEVVVPDGEPTWHTFRVWLDKGYSPRFTFPTGMLNVRNSEGRLFKEYNHLFPEHARDAKGVIAIRQAIMRYAKLPHLRIHEVEIRGPLVAQWPPAGRQQLLGNQPFAPERTREILRNFADRAYRRPARPDEIDRLMDVVNQRRKEGEDAFAALKEGLKTALCSPAFIYMAEPEEPPAKQHRLNAHALATRLSYFLWSTMPDAELRRVADSGELQKPDVLVAQARRLIASPRSEAFVNGFLDAWLNLRNLGDMAPDRDEFARYYGDNLQPAMKQETRLFARDLLARNESIVRFLDADYTFANLALARLYGQPAAVDPMAAHEFHRVTFTSAQRGGLLGHGSVLTVSANGVETSPVVRGVWVLENILGTPPAPPPDNVPPIDPDIRGAKSMREILAKHRDNPSCFECHRKIDPLGFALENFNPIGQWRARYEKGAPIETAGELPGGQQFDDIAGLKRVLAGRQDQFARMLTERLLSYACGRRIEPLDRPAVDRILAATKQDGYRFADLLEQVVLSPAFAPAP